MLNPDLHEQMSTLNSILPHPRIIELWIDYEICNITLYIRVRCLAFPLWSASVMPNSAWVADKFGLHFQEMKMTRQLHQ